MTNNTTLAYEVYQSRICLRVLLFTQEAISLELHLALVERIKRWVPSSTAAGPLRMKFRLRPLVAVI
jgi:hypothetical protein